MTPPPESFWHRHPGWLFVGLLLLAVAVAVFVQFYDTGPKAVLYAGF